MSKARDEAIALVLSHEGGYSDHPDDPGKKTNFGITEHTARRNGYVGDMRDMTREQAIEIYRHEYWDVVWEQLPRLVAMQVMDGAVNSGEFRSVRWLQQAAGVEADGIIGPVTLAAVRELSPADTVRRYNSIRLMYLTQLDGWGVFGKGWARRIAKNLEVT